MNPKVIIRRRLFNEDPKRRFSRIFHCPPDVWTEVWKRYKFLDYSREEARQYLILTLRQDISPLRFRRWVKRTETYNKAQVALKKGAEEVSLDYFGNLQAFVDREINKNR